MGKVTGFLEIERQDRKYKPAADRIRHWGEFVIPLTEEATRSQAARCMNCGIPYCHNGCPVNNQIPDWNDLVYTGDWHEASRNLHSTNNFPEFTGRVCPAPCEASCTLNIEDTPVTIKTIECAIVDRAWREGWIKPQPPEVQDRQEGRRHRRWPRRSCRRAAIGARRSQRPPLREAGQGRRLAALRHSRLQDGEASDRPPCRADGSAKASPSIMARISASPRMRANWSTVSTRWSSRAARKSRATCRSPAAISMACTSRCSSCRSRIAASPRSRRSTIARSSPAASMSW